MTTIVGVQYKDKAVIVADNQVTDFSASSMRRLNHPDMKKIAQRGPFLVAGSGEVAPCDIAQHFWNPPKITTKDHEDLYHYVITKAMPSLRKCLTDNGFDFNEGKSESKADGGEQRFRFIMAVGGELFDIADDLSVCRTDDGFYGVGSGADFALGALAAGATPEEAVNIACRFSVYSSGPLLVMEQTR
jgi:ATP-dependent protease HslVU (ClpYQ) peptidase subunit